MYRKFSLFKTRGYFDQIQFLDLRCKIKKFCRHTHRLGECKAILLNKGLLFEVDDRSWSLDDSAIGMSSSGAASMNWLFSLLIVTKNS